MPRARSRPLAFQVHADPGNKQHQRRGARRANPLRNQMNRLFGCTISLIYEDESGSARITSSVADRAAFWWNTRKPDEPVLFDSKIRLGEDFFNEIIRHPVRPGPRPLPVADRPDLHAPRSATALLAAGVPSVRFAPGPRQRQEHRPKLSPPSSARVEEDQAGLAGVELHHGSRRPDLASLEARDPSGTRTPAPRGIAPRFLPQERSR